jgi:hypothetical protein
MMLGLLSLAAGLGIVATSDRRRRHKWRRRIRRALGFT